MITVHHLNNSRSQRVLWLLEELGATYTVKRYERDKKTMLAPAALKAVHPLGKSPVISDANEVVAESGAIMEYLLETYAKGALQPAPGTAEYRQYRYWMHYAEGSLMPPLLLKLVFDKVASSPMPFFVKPIARKIAEMANKAFISNQIKTHLGFVEAELGKKAWFCGDHFTAADIQMSFPLEAAAARGAIDEQYPNIAAFLQRIHTRDAYQRALKTGGEYAYA
ncbi:MAG: glutathione S-transferase [Oceanospirillaceae bacterium]|nr:glutathione S-transferase [Oceanospirillaceae bacterium]MCP5349555.1 glutathione S-transferase [Oceanospirillaceae bacterium]